MPCDSVITNSVAVPKMNLEILHKALESIGYTVARYNTTLTAQRAGLTLTYEEGADMFTTRQQQYAAVADVNEIKRAYSQEIINTATNRFKWLNKKTGQRKGVIQKRS